MSLIASTQVDEPAAPLSPQIEVVSAEPRVRARRIATSSGTAGLAEHLRPQVLFPEARRLRRRRWAIGAGLVAVVLIAAGAALSSASHLWAAPGPGRAGRETTAALASGAHSSLYFRPVECTIAPASAGSAAKPVSTAVLPGPSGQVPCIATLAQQARYPSTPPSADKPGSVVVAPYHPLPSYAPTAERYVLGPAEMSGSVIASATAAHDLQIGGWVVDISFTKAGSAQFNTFAAKHYRCYAQDPTDPPFCALQAVVLDGRLLAAPALEARSFPGGATISGPLSAPYTKAQAVKLAALVRSSSGMAALHV